MAAVLQWRQYSCNNNCKYHVYIGGLNYSGSPSSNSDAAGRRWFRAACFSKKGRQATLSPLHHHHRPAGPRVFKDKSTRCCGWHGGATDCWDPVLLLD